MTTLRNEGDVKKVVKKLLTDIAAQYPEKLWYFMPPANGYGRSGIPDFVGGLNGFLFAIETKFGTNSLTPHQMQEIGALMRSNSKVWVVRETTLKSFEAELYAWCALCS